MITEPYLNNNFRCLSEGMVLDPRSVFKQGEEVIEKGWKLAVFRFLVAFPGGSDWNMLIRY